MDIQYRKASIKFWSFVFLALLWVFVILAYAHFFPYRFQDMSFWAKMGLVAILLYGVTVVVLFIKYVMTAEFAYFEKVNRQQRYERKKQKGTLNKVSFFEKKKFYYVTVPVGLIGWLILYLLGHYNSRIATEDLTTDPPVLTYILLLFIYTVFVITCMVLWRLRYYKRKDGSYF